MKLHPCLLNKIHGKLKQPYNDFNLTRKPVGFQKRIVLFSKPSKFLLH